VIEKKKDALKQNIQGVIQAESHKGYRDIADTLIQDSNARDVVAALLKMHYENDFDKTRYQDISESRREGGYSNTSGQVRLFVALGRKEGYNARSLLDLITKESGVENREINDLKMMEDFSFISVAPAQAEIITQAFADKTIQGKKAIINRAKESDRGGERRPYGDRKNFGNRKSYGERKPF
jgi:ATP-dependent RNA helicase DeaD